MTLSACADPLVVFDLRNGRVGGLTFCRIVEGWFDPEQSWMIDNDTSKAVEEWRALPQARRNNMRFIWGHCFSDFQLRAGLKRPLRIVGMVRHPLLKVSGLDVRSPEQLNTLDQYSLEAEMSAYRDQGGVLPSSSAAAFLDSHYMLGVTEMMEESLLVLRAKLNIDAHLTPWERLGAQANLNDNIYSHGLVSAFVKRPHYGREISYYLRARQRLTEEVHQLDRRHIADLALYKAACSGRDPTLQKWTAAFPDVFEPLIRVRQLTRPRRPRWLRQAAASSRLQFETKHWMVVLGRGEAELPRNGSLPIERDVLSPVLTLRLHHLQAPKPPNLLRIEFVLPPVDQTSRWVYCMAGDHKLFQVEVGTAAGVHAFEVPISSRLDQITLLINQYQATNGSRLYARLRSLQALRLPLDGSP